MKLGSIPTLDMFCSEILFSMEPHPGHDHEDFLCYHIFPLGKERNISIYALNFASLHFRKKYQSRVRMIKNIVRVLVSHRQLLGFCNISLFNFVAFSFSDKLSSLSYHLARLFDFSAWTFLILSSSDNGSSV